MDDLIYSTHPYGIPSNNPHTPAHNEFWYRKAHTNGIGKATGSSGQLSRAQAYDHYAPKFRYADFI